MTVHPAILGGDDPRLARLASLIAASPHNLVARGERLEIGVHIRESAAVADALAPLVAPGQHWVDLGTGGGLPGLVLALAHPSVEWRLVDAVRKKAAEVERFAAELGLVNVAVQAERAEALAHEPLHRGAAAGVVARAVAPLRVLVELARGFVDDGGWLAAVKGPAWGREVEAAAAAIERCAWGRPATRRVASAPRPTWLVTMQAVGAPPPGIPRRVGVPERRPF